MLPLRVEKVVQFNPSLFLRIGMILKSVMPSGRMLNSLEWNRLDDERVRIVLTWKQLSPEELKCPSLDWYKGRGEYVTIKTK